MKIFVVGNGAREAAIKEAVNACESIDEADLVIIGPEKPICEGLADEIGSKCIAVNKKFSQLESSKLFAKDFMSRHGIKHPKIVARAPFVVKQDGLCAGKGVTVHTQDCFVEEYIDGEEISVMSLFDGKTLLNFVPLRDFKRLSADKDAPNTGGMAAYCPVVLTKEQKDKLDVYLKQLESALIAEGADFTGFIYSGLIWSGDWYVLEYNVRLGDPETQALLTHLKTDFKEILIAAAQKRLDTVKLEYKDGFSACLVVAAQGYPDLPVTGDRIELPADPDVKVYLANALQKDGKLYSIGGRVLSLCTNSDDPFPVLKAFAKNVKMEHKYYRKDIHIS